MKKLFNKILIPIDFSSRSKAAVEKAVELANIYRCSIHLLHVAGIGPLSISNLLDGKSSMPVNAIENGKEIEFQIKKICNRVKFLSGNTIDVEHEIVFGSWNQAIVDFVNQHDIDLILIGQKGRFFNKRKMMLNPDFIAENANVPVITVPANRRITKLYSIVVPVTDFLPVRKLMYAVYMALNFDSTIKLLGIENTKTENVRYYLNKSCDLIKEYCSVSVETEIVAAWNVAEAVNQFAMMKSVDLIIVNPGTQSKMPGFFSAFINNIIQKYSVPPVLTVNRI